ncbi:hypothetical protein [Arthronema virus TR020]|uniref:Uncharacterized protein n=1 Tax=Arthronema virus TR020 TaxID=2736280 RepID=A0A7G3WH15_9CAUD|nr:hypothetical protein [Arthronema virus TR020]
MNTRVLLTFLVFLMFSAHAALALRHMLGSHLQRLNTIEQSERKHQ